MKILFVSDTYYPHLNGVYYFVCRLAPLLQKRGHEIAVIAPSETTSLTLKKIDGLDVYGIPSLPVLYYPKVRFPIPVFQSKKLKSIITDFNPDVIHVQDHFAIAKAVIKVSRELNIPVVGTNHFMTENLTFLLKYEKWRERLSDILWNSFSNVFNEVQIVTTPSDTAAKLIRSKLNTPVISISSGIDLNQFNPVGDKEIIRKKYNIPDKPCILFVGRLDPEKNIEEILDAVSLALKKVDFCCLIVGKGLRQTDLKERAKKLNLENDIIFTGYVSEEDLPYIYKLSQCFVISSVAELLSLSALQGMAAALPIVAVNEGALAELVKPGVNGYLYEKGDIRKLAENICLVLNPINNRKMGERSFEMVQKHDIHHSVVLFEKLYQQLSRSPHKQIWREQKGKHYHNLSDN